MSTVRIPAKKVMEPDMNINDIECFWDYIDLYVEEETPNESESYFNDDEDIYDDICYDCDDDSWDDYDSPYMSDKDWDYYGAFEGDPEAVWGRER